MLTEALQSEAETLEREIASLETKRRRLDLIRQLLSTYNSDPAQRALFQPTAEEGGKFYSGASLTNAVLHLLRQHPDDWYTAKEVRDTLIAGGYQSDSPNLLIMISNVCQRKALDSNPLQSGEKNGTRAYRWNVPAHPLKHA